MTLTAVIILVIIVLAAIVLVVSLVFSGIVIHSRRQPIVQTPEKFNLTYEDVEFKSTDGLIIRGWFIPAESGRTDKVILLTHPMPMYRHGFLAKNQGFPSMFKTDIDLLRRIAALQQAGYPVLAFDLRSHGESENGTTGNGLSEYQDVLGTVNYINDRADLKVEEIGFVCFCMGAASAMTALSKGKDKLTNARFLVAIQPVTSSVFFRSYMKAVYTPLSLLLVPIVDKIVQLRGGYAFNEMAPGRF
jgi:alpha/beta superfamily hydrolase